MTGDEPKKGTKINARGTTGRENPLRGVTKKEAARTLKANAAGKNVNADKLKASKRKAADHYAGETRNASGKTPFWKR